MTTSTIGRYTIIRELGAGGMAVVYLAQDPLMQRQVAVKVLPRQFTFDPQFRSRFQREAQVIAGLEHPAIVPVYDFGEHDDQPYIVMRLMPGGSLADRMEKGPLSLPEISAVLHRLASALDAAHAHGLVHRDLKPANILFDQWGEAYLSDFGIVKLAEARSAYTGSAIIGTPAYMSPEQAKGKTQVDGRSDVYSLGIILYELLTRQLPFVADTPMGQAVAHIIEPVPDILKADPALPRAWDAIIRQALAKNPDDRYPTAGALAGVVAQLAANPKLNLPVPAAKPLAAAGGAQGQAGPGSAGARRLTPLPPSSGRPSTGQTILQKARSPWTVAFTGAGMLIILGLVSVICVSGTFAFNYLRRTATDTASAPARSTTTLALTETAPATGTATATASASEMATLAATATASPTLTATLSPTRTRAVSTHTHTPEPPTPTMTPTPNCIPPEYFDPLLNRCRIDNSGTVSSNPPSGGGGSGGGSQPTSVPTSVPVTATP